MIEDPLKLCAAALCGMVMLACCGEQKDAEHKNLLRPQKTTFFTYFEKGKIMSFDAFKNNPLYWEGTDSERMEQALAWAVEHHLPLEVTAKKNNAPWLIDRAILLPEGSEIRIIDCKIKLSDACRDNFIRSANCGIGIKEIKPIRDLRITGIGKALLEGADHPRCTADAAKKLGLQAIGTDTGKAAESQRGDWRNIGILFANVQNFVIENVRIVNSHCWGISLEHCSEGTIRNLIFEDDTMVDYYGKHLPILNQDGLDLRRGCHHITIDGIYGYSGDDLIALTTIPSSPREAGSLNTSEVSSGGKITPADDIHDVVIRNVRGWSTGGHQIIRLLNAAGIKLHHITIENVEDLTPENHRCLVALRIGDTNPAWGGSAPLGDTHHITVKNLISRRCLQTILVAGSLADSSFENVRNLNTEMVFFGCKNPEKQLKNVTFTECPEK